MMKYLRYALIAVALLSPSLAEAAARFWNPYAVTGSASGSGGVCRLTISPAITGGGLLTGDTVVSTATNCTGTNTITVIDSTHVDLAGTTFTATGTGALSGGHWTSGNTSNWASSSTATAGSGGQTVPGSADTVTFDANSLGGIVGVVQPNNATGLAQVNIGQLTMGAFTGGTLDFTNGGVTNNNVTFASNSFSVTGTVTRALKLGSGTFTLVPIATTAWDCTVSTGMTLTSGSETFVVPAPSGTGNTQSFIGNANCGGSGYGSLTINGRANGVEVTISGANTFSNLNISGPITINFPANVTTTVTNSVSWSGSASALISLTGGVNSAITSTIALGSAGNTASWSAFRNITFSTNTLNASSSFDLGANLGTLSITPPSTGGGSRCIGC